MFCYEISDEETIRPKYNNSDGYTLNKLTDIFLIPHNSPPFGNLFNFINPRGLQSFDPGFSAGNK